MNSWQIRSWSLETWTGEVIYQLLSLPVLRHGENWYNFRTVLNKRMLHPRDSAQYGDTFNNIITDFFKRICYLRQCSPTGDLVTNVNQEFHHFSLEGLKKTFKVNQLHCACFFKSYALVKFFFSWFHLCCSAIASILFETKLGCLENEIPKSTQDFINSVSKMFSNNFIVVLLPRWTRSILPFWGRYIAGWDGIFNFGELWRRQTQLTC